MIIRKDYDLPITWSDQDWSVQGRKPVGVFSTKRQFIGRYVLVELSSYIWNMVEMSDPTPYKGYGISDVQMFELIEMKNVAHLNIYKLLIGLQCCICGEKDCRVKNKSSLTRPHKQFWNPSRLKTENWACLAHA